VSVPNLRQVPGQGLLFGSVDDLDPVAGLGMVVDVEL
jgi:hypothetical protein